MRHVVAIFLTFALLLQPGSPPATPVPAGYPTWRRPARAAPTRADLYGA